MTGLRVLVPGVPQPSPTRLPGTPASGLSGPGQGAGARGCLDTRAGGLDYVASTHRTRESGRPITAATEKVTRPLARRARRATRSPSISRSRRRPSGSASLSWNRSARGTPSPAGRRRDPGRDARCRPPRFAARSIAGSLMIVLWDSLARLSCEATLFSASARPTLVIPQRPRRAPSSPEGGRPGEPFEQRSQAYSTQARNSEISRVD